MPFLIVFFNLDFTIRIDERYIGDSFQIKLEEFFRFLGLFLLGKLHKVDIRTKAQEDGQHDKISAGIHSYVERVKRAEKKKMPLFDFYFFDV